MKQKNNVLLFAGIGLIIVGLVLGVVLDRSEKISNIISVVTTMIGIFTIFYQFVKSKQLNQVAFMVAFNDMFYSESRKNVELLKYFDKLYDDPNSTPPLTEKNLDMISPYSGWLNILCALILRRIFNFELATDMFQYKFFSFMNNKDIQRLEIEKFPELYAAHFEVYYEWVKYLEKNGIKEINADVSLSKTEVYQNYIKNGQEFLNEMSEKNNRVNAIKRKRKLIKK